MRRARLVRSFGKGLMVFPHGIHIDRDGNVWVTDGQDNLPRRARGAAPDAPLPPAPATPIGHPVFKFSPEGKVLLTLGKRGGNQPGQPAEPSSFYQPNDVAVAPNGDIYVSEGHGGAKDGKVIAFIPEPVEKTTNTSAAEGVAVDRDGNVYGAEVGPRAPKKYVRQ